MADILKILGSMGVGVTIESYGKVEINVDNF
jgi:pantoate kinase